MFVRYPPGKIRCDGDRPVALLGVRVAPSFRLVDLPLGLPTTSARTSRGAWALYPIGAEVVVVHPDGAVSGPPAECFRPQNRMRRSTTDLLRRFVAAASVADHRLLSSFGGRGLGSAE